MKYEKAGETQVASLTLGFLIVQLLRTGITGYLPMPNGDPNPAVAPTVKDIVYLSIGSLVLAVLMILVYQYMPEVPGFPRVKLWTKGACSFGCAFSALYASVWATFALFDLTLTPGKLLAAFDVTIGGFLTIVLLTSVHDMNFLSEHAKEEIMQLQVPLSTLIGFAWKAAFMQSIASITGNVAILPAPIESMIMALVLVLVVLPAWLFYIIPLVMAMDKPDWKPRGGALTAQENTREAAKPLLGNIAPAPSLKDIDDILGSLAVRLRNVEQGI